MTHEVSFEALIFYPQCLAKYQAPSRYLLNAQINEHIPHGKHIQLLSYQVETEGHSEGRTLREDVHRSVPITGAAYPAQGLMDVCVRTS